VGDPIDEFVSWREQFGVENCFDSVDQKSPNWIVTVSAFGSLGGVTDLLFEIGWSVGRSVVSFNH